MRPLRVLYQTVYGSFGGKLMSNAIRVDSNGGQDMKTAAVSSDWIVKGVIV